ncbi:potassium voltage-gated channel subfamily E member 4-like [Lethenteron reissneri]|uniref:potassium voltage-gated channel subfamily E member 4-like n=1 Tax=Lethenteron reissneri TaxID=7753 RepID=UPI002AB73483|nr:potassium voltage-gated channel subfamily E member 4-like [Lethenteron reissneri]
MDAVNGTRLSAHFSGPGAAPDMQGLSSATATSATDNQPKTLYILILVSFYGFFLLLVLLGYLRTKKPLSSQDPFHLYVQREWLAPARPAAAAAAGRPSSSAATTTGEPARCPSASSSGSSASASSRVTAAASGPSGVPEIRVEAPTGEGKLRPLCLAERRMGIAAV